MSRRCDDWLLPRRSLWCLRRSRSRCFRRCATFDPCFSLTWIPGGEDLIRIDSLSAHSCPSRQACGCSRWRSPPRLAGSPPGLRRTGARDADADVVSHRKRGCSPAVVGGICVDIPVRARRSGAPVSTPSRGGLVGHIDTAVCRRSRAACGPPGVRNTMVETVAMWLIVVVAALYGRALSRFTRGSGGVRSRTAGTGHPVQRTAGRRIHHYSADRAEGIAHDVADHRLAGAWDRRVRRSPCAGAAQHPWPAVTCS